MGPFGGFSTRQLLLPAPYGKKERRKGFQLSHVHGLVIIPTTPYLLPASYDTRGHSSKFLVPSTRVNAFRYSYFPATIMSWNGLPHTLSNHHQLNASNFSWQNFTLYLLVPSLLIVVFISHSHTPLLYLHTVLHCHIVLHTWQSCIIFLFLFILIFFIFHFYYIFIFLCRGCTTMLSLSPVHYRNR